MVQVTSAVAGNGYVTTDLMNATYEVADHVASLCFERMEQLDDLAYSFEPTELVDGAHFKKEVIGMGLEVELQHFIAFVLRKFSQQPGKFAYTDMAGDLAHILMGIIPNLNFDLYELDSAVRALIRDPQADERFQDIADMN